MLNAPPCRFLTILRAERPHLHATRQVRQDTLDGIRRGPAAIDKM